MAKETKLTAVDDFRKLMAKVASSHRSVSMELRVQFAALVAKRLRDNRWTQTKLAERAGMPQSSISEIIHADENCTLETIGRILFALGVRGRIVAISEDEALATRLGDSDETFLIGSTDGKEAWFEIDGYSEDPEIAACEATEASADTIGPHRSGDLGRSHAHHDAQGLASGDTRLRDPVSRRAHVR